MFLPQSLSHPRKSRAIFQPRPLALLLVPLHCMCCSSSHPGQAVQPLTFHYVCKNRLTSSPESWLQQPLSISMKYRFSSSLLTFCPRKRKVSPTKKEKWSLEIFHDIEIFSTIISAWNKYFFVSFVSKHTSNTHSYQPDIVCEESWKQQEITIKNTC